MPNKASLATRERLEELADPFEFLARVMRGEPIDAAPGKDAAETVSTYPTIDQRLTAARWLGERLLPPAKGRLVTLDLPAVESPDDLSRAISAVVAAIGAGTISSEEALSLVGVLEVKRKAVETVELEKRITAIEEQGNARKH